MVAHLLRLKLTLLRNGLRRSPWQLVGMAIAGLYALGVVATLVFALVLLRGAGPATADTAVVLGGSAAILGWAVIPVVASATDMTLDPARFTTFAVPRETAAHRPRPRRADRHSRTGHRTRRTLHRGDLVRGLLPALAALLGACLGVITCVVLAKVVTTATAGLAASRRFKDISAIAFMVPLVLLGPIVAGLAAASPLPRLPARVRPHALLDSARGALGARRRRCRRQAGGGRGQAAAIGGRPWRPGLVLETAA